MLIISSLCSVITALYLQYKAAFFFHQHVTAVEFHFYVIIACCLLLAPEYAQKHLVTEVLSENIFGHTFFSTLVLSKMAGHTGV